jgi:hypothetical protein
VEWPDGGDTNKLELVSVSAPPADLVGSAQVLVDKGCQKQLDLLVEGASKVGK